MSIPSLKRPIPLNIRTSGDLRKLWDLLRTVPRHLTWKKLLNLLLVEYEYFLGKTELRSRPYFLKIDPTNRCTLRCPLCPRLIGDRHFKAKGPIKYGDLPFSTFKKIIDELKDYLFTVILYGMGEPFLAADILEMVEYATKNNIGVRISSNLNDFRREDAERLVLSGLEHLSFALDGLDQETYATFRVGGDFNRVVANVSSILDARKRLRSKTPFMEWQFLVMKHTVHQIPAARRMAREMGIDSISFVPVGNIDPRRKDLLEKWVPAESRYVRYDINSGIDARLKRKRNRCSWLYRGVFVNWDGWVWPCCYFPSFEESKFGNILHGEFAHIWNNECYVTARALFNKREKKYEERKAGICHICKHKYEED
ncbi:MAG: radical SAM protein [Candidatus Aureabacteria bacterium]|nr:radical SAM protein [Candidatus Auribacterota bacterium]